MEERASVLLRESKLGCGRLAHGVERQPKARLLRIDKFNVFRIKTTPDAVVRAPRRPVVSSLRVEHTC